MIILLALLMFDGPARLETTISLAALPADSEFFLQAPVSFDVDKNGNYYVLDAEAGTIFSWDPSGRFRKSIGKAGEGPGEFQFGGRGPAMGFVSAAGDQLVVYDPRKNNLQYFDFNGQFIRALPLGGGRGRVMYFTETADGKYLMYKRTRLDDGFFAIVQLLDKEGTVLETLQKRKDDTFTMGPGGGGGGRGRPSIKPFNPVLVLDYDRKSAELAMGFSGEAGFDVIGRDGKSRKIKVPLMRKDVTQADKDEYMKRFETSQRVPDVEWPGQMAFYTNLLALGEKGFLVYNQSPHYGRVEGVRLDREGNARGRVNLTLGTGGSLLSASGRTLMVKTNEDDEFELKEITIE